MPDPESQTENAPNDGPSPGIGAAPASDFVIVSTTTDTEGSARVIAEALVHHRLAACAHHGRIQGVHRWHGKVTSVEEHVVEAVTRRDLFDRVVAQIHELHPYDLPQVVATSIIDGTEAYLRWIDESVARA